MKSTVKQPMPRRRWAAAVAVLAGTTLLSLLATPAVAATVALTGATVHPVSSAPIPDGVVVVEGGKIVAVGDSTTAVPADATRVDLAGQHLYPGFVHPLSVLGLVEVSSVRGTRDFREIGEVNSDLRAEVAVNADSLLLPVTVAGGVLTAHVAQQGGVFTGTSAVIGLRGWNWEDMTMATPVGMHLAWPQLPEGADDADDKETSEKELALIDETFAAARAYRTARDGGPGTVDVNAKLEALIPVLDGELPLYIRARSKKQIESALDWAEKEGFDNLVLVVRSDAQYVAERLAAAKIPVILNGVLSLPARRWEPYDLAYRAPAVLHEAGVRFAIGDGSSSFGAAHSRNLPFEAAMAAAFGLPKDVALRSVTLSPAEILGVADRVGSLEVGKDATFFAASGDPLEIRTRIERVWIGGEEVDLDDEHQRRLWRKYRDRPQPAAE